MAINLGAAYVDIVPSTSGLAGQLKSQLGDPISQAGDTASRGFGDRFTSGFRSVASGIGSMLSSAITGAAGVAAAGLGTALFTGWNRVTTIEDSTAALTISLGDASAAAAVLDDVLSVVSGTPFNLDQFASAAQRMVGMGIEADKIPGYLTAIGEASATQGSRANEFADRLSTVFGQVAAAGRITGGDIRSLEQTGVNALAILANHFGVTTEEMRKMVSSGAVPATEALDVLSKGILEGSDGAAGATVALAGTMEGLRETLSGASGGFRSSLARLGASIIEPLSGALTVGFNAASDIIDTLGGRIGDALGRLTDMPGWSWLMEDLANLPSKVGPALDKLKDLGPALAPLAGALGAIGMSSLSGLLGPLGKLLPVINPVVAAIVALVASSPELRKAFTRILDSLMPLLPIIADLADTLIQALVPVIDALATALIPVVQALLPPLVHVFEMLAPVVADVATILAGILVQAIEALAPALPALAEAFGAIAIAAAEILVALTPLIPPLAELVTLLITRIGAPAIVAIAEAFARLAGAIAPIVTTIAELFAAGLATAIDLLVRFVDAMINFDPGAVADWFADLPGKIFGWIGDGTSVLREKGWDLVTGLWNGAIDRLSSVASWFRDLPGKAVGWIGNTASTLWNKGWDLLTGLWNGIWDRFVILYGWVVGLPGNILGLIGDTGRLLWDAGWKLIGGFLQGIRDRIPSLQDLLGWVTNLIPSWKGPEDVDSKLLYGAGRLIIEGLGRGMRDEMDSIHALLGGFTGDLSSNATLNMHAVHPTLNVPTPPTPHQGDFVGVVDGDVFVRFMRKQDRKRGGRLLMGTA